MSEILTHGRLWRQTKILIQGLTFTYWVKEILPNDRMLKFRIKEIMRQRISM
jgi:hypothetical protein